jgi:hypothetical protein
MKSAVGIVVAMLVYLAASLTPVALIGWVVYHFASKYW